MDGFSVIRGPLLVLDWLLFVYATLLATRVFHQFYVAKDTVVNELIWQVKYASNIALGFFYLCKISFVASFMYFAVDYDSSKKLPLAWIISTGVCYAIGLVALYALFMIRLWVSFEGTKYSLKSEDLRVLYSWFAVTLFTAVLGSVLWNRRLSDNAIQRRIALVLIAVAGVSHISMNLYFVRIFVGRLRDLLRQSTHLTVSSMGTSMASTAKVKQIVKSMSSMDLDAEVELCEEDDFEDDENFQSDIPTSLAVLRPGFEESHTSGTTTSSTQGTQTSQASSTISGDNNSTNHNKSQSIQRIDVKAEPIALSDGGSTTSNTSTNKHKRSATPGSPTFSAMAQSARKLVTMSLRDMTVEEKAARNVLKDSQIEDKTMIVVMVRYTLLKIVSVLSSFMALMIVVLVMAIDVEKSETKKKIHETEIVMFFLSVDSVLNITVLFFTYYTFGVSWFNYDLICGRLEGCLMHGFEQWLKQDFYEQLLIEAKRAVDIVEGEIRESFKRQRSDSRTVSAQFDSKITSETRSRTRSGIASALI